MTSIPRTALLATAIVAAGLASPASTAAESYDSCTGFIESLPATISTQGVWCLRRNLATAMTSGNAITITVNNVTIDCNDFKIGGLAAGDESKTVGIAADDVLNATVRQCADIMAQMNEMMIKGTPAQVKRLTEAFCDMKKYDVKTLEKAYRGE